MSTFFAVLVRAEEDVTDVPFRDSGRIED